MASEEEAVLVPRDPRAEAAARGRTKPVEVDPLLTRTGGAYIPPAKLRQMQEQTADKSSAAYQRTAVNRLYLAASSLPTWLV